VRNRRRVVYYAILILLILGELLGERNYIIIIFPEYDKVKPTVPPRENKEEEEEVILICPSPPPNKSTTTLSSNKSMALASENPNTQLSEEIDNLITSLKQFKVPSNVTRFLPPAGYHTISRNRENSSRYWNWIVKGLLESKQNSETVRRGFVRG